MLYINGEDMEVKFNTKKYLPDITGPSADSFIKDINEAINEDVTEVLIDFSNIKLISSSAMGTLFTLHQSLKTLGGGIKIVNATDSVIHLLRMVNLDKYILYQ